jgi:hypothetical protein
MGKWTRHGKSYSPEYQVWENMKQRCTNLNHPQYKDWGGREISYDPRWESFDNFYSDMGDRPSSTHTLERKDNDGNYSKDNCEWATPVRQGRNRRTTTMVEFDGKPIALRDLCEELGLNHDMVRWRYKYGGWTLAKALGVEKGRVYLYG